MMKKKMYCLSIFILCICFCCKASDDVKKTADTFLHAMISGDYVKMASFINDKEGIRLSPIPFIYPDFQRKFVKNEIANCESDTALYNWFTDDPDNPDELTIKDFIQRNYRCEAERFSKDSINTFITSTGYDDSRRYNNFYEIYPKCKFVEYYASPSGTYGEMDWFSVCIILQAIDGDYYVVAVTCNYQGI